MERTSCNLAGLFVLAVLWGISSSVATAGDDDGKSARGSEKRVEIRIQVDQDGVHVNSSGLENSEEIAALIQKKLAEAMPEFVLGKPGPKQQRIEIRKVLSGKDVAGKEFRWNFAPADGGHPMVFIADGKKSPGKSSEKRMLLRALEGGHKVKVAAVPKGDGEIAVTVVSGQDEVPTHRLGIAIVGQAGLVIGDVAKGSPADKAGIEDGDLLIAVNRNMVGEVSELLELVSKAGRDHKKLSLTIVRDHDELRTIEVTPAKIENQEHEADNDHEEDADENDDQDGGRDRQSRTDSGRTLRWQALVEGNTREVEKAREAVERSVREARAHVKKHVHELAAERDHHLAQQHAQAMHAARTSELTQLRQDLEALRKEVAELKENLDDRD